MRNKPKIPRIVKIESIKGHQIQCMFNNGESRLLDFQKIFKLWDVKSDDVEYPLLDIDEFKKVSLRNYSLSWSNIKVAIHDEDGKQMNLAYEIGADTLYELSEPIKKSHQFHFGSLIKNARIKAGLTQEELAKRIGTTRFYISRVENDKTDLEISTLRKIIEAGLGKKLKISIE